MSGTWCKQSLAPFRHSGHQAIWALSLCIPSLGIPVIRHSGPFPTERSGRVFCFSFISLCGQFNAGGATKLNCVNTTGWTGRFRPCHDNVTYISSRNEIRKWNFTKNRCKLHFAKMSTTLVWLTFFIASFCFCNLYISSVQKILDPCNFCLQQCLQQLFHF